MRACNRPLVVRLTFRATSPSQQAAAQALAQAGAGGGPGATAAAQALVQASSQGASTCTERTLCARPSGWMTHTRVHLRTVPGGGAGPWPASPAFSCDIGCAALALFVLVAAADSPSLGCALWAPAGGAASDTAAKAIAQASAQCKCMEYWPALPEPSPTSTPAPAMTKRLSSFRAQRTVIRPRPLMPVANTQQQQQQQPCPTPNYGMRPHSCT